MAINFQENIMIYILFRSYNGPIIKTTKDIREALALVNVGCNVKVVKEAK